MHILGMPTLMESHNDLPPQIMGYISVKGKESVFAERPPQLPSTAKAYHASHSNRDMVRKSLEASGFVIVAESALGLSVCAKPKQFEELTGGTVVPMEKLMYTTECAREYVTCLDIVGTGQPKHLGVGHVKSRALKTDGVVIETPRQHHSFFPSPIPLQSSKPHLQLPNDVAVLLGATVAHQQGFHGDGVVVAMPDTGWYSHPYFVANGYKVKKPLVAVPGTSPSQDPMGHGTGESANIFALAPGAVLQPVRTTNNKGDSVGTIGAFLKAKNTNARIITNSWSGDDPYPPGLPSPVDLVIYLEVLDAIENGKLIIFSAGNGHFSIEPQIPGVLSAGGVFIDKNGKMMASDYASGYKSPWFKNVVVPTVCGLVGMQPRAQYLMLPVQPGCQLDVEMSEVDTESGEVGDGTSTKDGWAMFSGTSAAAPQVAGAAALILGAKPDLKPAQVIEALSKTAVDVINGRSFPQRYNEPAGPGQDFATGWGLIDAAGAVAYANKHF